MAGGLVLIFRFGCPIPVLVDPKIEDHHWTFFNYFALILLRVIVYNYAVRNYAAYNFLCIDGCLSVVQLSAASAGFPNYGLIELRYGSCVCLHFLH
jgi:hypothetical protein